MNASRMTPLSTLARKSCYSVPSSFVRTVITDTSAAFSLPARQSGHAKAAKQARGQISRHASALHKSPLSPEKLDEQASYAQAAVPERHDVLEKSVSPQPMSFELISKSNIPAMFAKYAPHLDPSDYIASATVFPMRANN